MEKCTVTGVCNSRGDNYLFESDGTLAVGDSHTELYDFKNSTYAVRADGTLVSGKIAKIDGYQYYFNSKENYKAIRLFMWENIIITLVKMEY